MQLKKLTQSISLALMATASHHADAATIEIDEQCSLIEAIQAANSDAVVGGCEAGDGNDVINFTTPDTRINLTQAFGSSQFEPQISVGLPTITSHITIEGNGLTISKDDPDDQFRLMEVLGEGLVTPQTASLHLKNTTLTGGNATLVGNRVFRGGALYVANAGLHLENCQLTQNNNALAIARSYDALIENSVFRDNKTINVERASAISIRRSNTTISHASIVNNRRTVLIFPSINIPPRGEGTLHIYGGNASVINSTISGNFNENTGAVVVDSERSTFAPSQTSPFLGNLPNRGGANYQVTISHSTITGNTANVAAGLVDETLAEYTNLTLSGNIISGNVARGYQEGNNLFSSSNNLYLNGNNIFGEYGNTGVSGAALGESDQVLQTGTSDLLYPLTKSNGQFVHPLKANTVAIDALPGSCSDLVTDQEGSPRVLDGDGDGVAACDIGAAEKTPEILVDANCSFTDAIVAANTDTAVGSCIAGLGADVIHLPRNSQQSFTTVAATLDGHNFGLPLISSGVIVDGNSSTITRDSNAPDFGILGVQQGGDLALINTTISNGSGTFAGIFSDQGNISLLNSAVSEMNGVAVLNSNGAKMLIQNSTISHNDIPQGPQTPDFGNGAIQTDTVKITGSSFHNNSGGKGAALDLRNNAYNSLINSTISTNTSNSSSAFVIEGSANISGLTVTNNNANTNSGGAYFLTQSYDANFSESKNIKIRNSIFSGNSLSEFSAEVDAQKGVSTTEIFNVENVGQGVSSINNIFGQNGIAGVGTIEIDTDSMVPAAGVETVIGPLQNNGGFSLSHTPTLDSIAIDNGSTLCLLVKDQANHIRPFDGDGDGDERCDIGAIESGSFNPDDLIFKDGFND